MKARWKTFSGSLATLENTTSNLPEFLEEIWEMLGEICCVELDGIRGYVNMERIRHLPSNYEFVPIDEIKTDKDYQSSHWPEKEFKN